MSGRRSRREFLRDALGTPGLLSFRDDLFARGQGAESERLCARTGEQSPKQGEKETETRVDVIPDELGRPLRHLEVGGVPTDVRKIPSFRGPKRLGFIRHGGITQYMNHREVFSFGQNRNLICDWSDMDADIDVLRAEAVGVQPLLGYMPAIIADHKRCSQWGHSIGIHTSPPTDYRVWEEMCYRAVRHFNIERKQEIKYWEVWNEPNATGFWQAPFNEYLKLYDHAVRGAKRADPTIKVGGPTLTVSGPAVVDRPTNDQFPPEILTLHAEVVAEWAPAAIPTHTNYHGESPFALMAAFIKHCGESEVPLDFLTWHNYNDAPGMDPFDLTTIGGNIRLFRSWLDNYSHLKCVELVIDEWGILGDPGTTKAAMFHGSALIEMENAGLSFQENYEVVDAEAGRATGPGPSEPLYWRRPAAKPAGASDVDRAVPVQNLTEMFALLGRMRCQAESNDSQVRALASHDGDDIALVLVRFAPDAPPRDVLVTVAPLPRGRSWRTAGYLLGSKRFNVALKKDGFRLERGKNADMFRIRVRMEGLSAAALKLSALG